MTVLLLSGSGPAFKNVDYLRGSLLDPAVRDPFPAARDPRLADLTAHRLVVDQPGRPPQPLLRERRVRGRFLVTQLLESILYSAGEEHESFLLNHVWDGNAEPATTDPEVVLLSTTFICNTDDLAGAVRWVEDRFPGVPLVLGGQYSNLKFSLILRRHPSVRLIVRGDGEEALPRVLQALRGRDDLTKIPNLVQRADDGTIRTNPIGYVDLETFPAPAFPDLAETVPYESMRGCPFSCRFCSYPAASPLWRYKSAEKIHADWNHYAEHNGTRHVQALDSTFTVPRIRLRGLLPMLRSGAVTWEAYTRANGVYSAAVADALEESRCTKLSIGFESMSPRTLDSMHKQVRASQNRVAHDILRDRGIRYRVSFMVGYPGETPADYELTRRYIVDEFRGHFMLNVFSFTDETMPVWQDSQRFSLRIHDPRQPDYSWSHSGMDVATARSLYRETLREARWGSADAVLLLWQAAYELPLVPGSGRADELRQEKYLDRLVMLPVDIADPAQRARRASELLDALELDGVRVAPPNRDERSEAR